MSKKSFINNKNMQTKVISFKKSSNNNNDYSYSPELEKRFYKENDNQKILRINNSKEKSSKIIADYSKPLLELAETQDDIIEYYQIAILLWNIAVLPENQRQEWFKKDDSPNDFFKDEKMFVEYMIKRKTELFSSHIFMVKDFEIEFFKHYDYRISVVTVRKDEIE
ncbi:MAG: hypothetical protein QG635_1326 [Bacteroidota bacterium]|nr:hypothetical protein [Bacteroidota bacterium]